MALKHSKYNFQVKGNDKLLLFNTFTGAFLQINKTVANKVLNWFESGCDERKIEPSIEERLKYGGFVVDYKTNETEELLKRFMKLKYNNTTSLTICPTLKCNLACTYCFEDSQAIGKDMSDEIESNIVEFVRKSIIEGSKEVLVTYYGGEPLLQPQRILSLQKKLGALSEKLTSLCITNGTLLTSDIYNKLSKSGVKRFQITLDGSKHTHDRRRITHCGKGSFNDIVQNLKEINLAGASIVVRVNVDKKNMNEVIELYRYFNSDERLRRYLYDITPCPVVAWPSLTSEAKRNCFSVRDFSDWYLELSNQVYKEFNINILTLPKPTTTGCASINSNVFIIGPEGEIYKCWTDVGNPELVVGYIGTKIKENIKILNFWENWNPLNLNSCKKCKLLPACAGGCPEKYHVNINGDGQPECIRHNHHIPKLMRIIDERRHGN